MGEKEIFNTLYTKYNKLFFIHENNLITNFNTLYKYAKNVVNLYNTKIIENITYFKIYC